MPELPPFQVVAGHYRDLIRSGALAAGEALPSRRAMTEQHGQAGAAIDRAVGVLAREGLIVVNGPPKPVTVAEIPSRHTSLGDRLASVRATGNALGDSESSVIVAVGVVPCPPDVAVRLGIGAGEDVLHRKRVTSLDDHPAAMSVSYYPPEVSALTPELSSRASIPAGSRELACQRLGSPQRWARQEVIGRLSTREESELLGLPAYAMVLEVTRTVFVEDGRTVEVAVKTADARRRVTFDSTFT